MCLKIFSSRFGQLVRFLRGKKVFYGPVKNQTNYCDTTFKLVKKSLKNHFNDHFLFIKQKIHHNLCRIRGSPTGCGSSHPKMKKLNFFFVLQKQDKKC